jgi:glycosyltransferase involved in cell wall biosynthesis
MKEDNATLIPSRGSTAASPDVEVLVCLPALNESASIAGVINRIPRKLDGVSRVDVVVIDDGSTDDTAAQAESVGAEVLRHVRNRGVGAAFHTALKHGIESGADVIVTIDSDGQFDPADIPKLIAPVLSGEADFSTASRFKDPALVPDAPWIKRWGNRVMSWLISRLTGQRFWDVSCGFRCYGRRAALNLFLLGRFTYTQEVFMNLAFKGLHIVEVPIRVRGVREHGQSRVANNLFKYGSRTLRIILRCYRDFHPLRFFGAAAAVLGVPAFLLAAFLGWHYLSTGSFSPHKWAGFSAGALIILALVMLHMGITGDMLNRHRLYLEELLYYRRVESQRDRHSRSTEDPGT